MQLLPSVEFALQLEVTMAHYLGHPHAPAFSWKSDPTLRELKHIQVDGPGRAYLFFFDKQGRHGFTHKAAQAMQAHVGEAFAEWISHSAHFAANTLSLAQGWHHVVVASEQRRHRSQAEGQGTVIATLASSESDSTPQLVGSAPPSATRIGAIEDNGGNKSAQATSARLHGRPSKV